MRIGNVLNKKEQFAPSCLILLLNDVWYARIVWLLVHWWKLSALFRNVLPESCVQRVWRPRVGWRSPVSFSLVATLKYRLRVVSETKCGFPFSDWSSSAMNPKNTFFAEVSDILCCIMHMCKIGSSFNGTQFNWWLVFLLARIIGNGDQLIKRPCAKKFTRDSIRAIRCAVA